MVLSFDTKGNEKQKECAKYWLDGSVIDIVYGGAKGGGKSFLGCSLIFGDALIYPETHYFIARKTLADLRKFTMPSVKEVMDVWGLDERYYKFNSQYSYYELNNGSKVFLLDAKHMPSDPDYTRFGSMQMTRGWIEEAGEFSQTAKNNLQASIGRWKNEEYNLEGKLLQTCNPTNNYLFNDYFLPHDKGELETHKKFIQAFPQDNKQLPKNYISNLYKILSPTQIERLIKGNWRYDDDPSKLCDFDAVNDIFTNTHVPSGVRRISADLAMGGRDRFVAGYWDGLHCNVAVDMAKSDARQIENALTVVKNSNSVGNSNIVADVDGLGNYLSAYIKNIKKFRGGQRAVKHRDFDRIKDECGFKLAEKINNRDIRISCNDSQKEQITKELINCLKQDNLNIDKKKLIKKDKMKELLSGGSPDYLDMLLMGMYFHVKQTQPLIS